MNPDPTPKPKQSRYQTLQYGMLFELCLIGCFFLLPNGMLFDLIRNFVIVVHLPAMLVMSSEFFDGPALSISITLVLFLGMSWVWGMLIQLVKRRLQTVLQRLSPQRQKQLRLGAVVAGVALLVWLGLFHLPAKPRPFIPSAEAKVVVDANNVFALDLYAQLKGQPDNLFFSPFGVSSSLAMVARGAHGDTESELTNALHLGLSADQTGTGYRTLIERMARVERWNRITLRSANSLWCQSGHPFVPDFTAALQRDFSAEVRSVDFKGNADAAAGEINRWVDTRTAHRIPHAVAPGQLTADTRMALGNAIYFKGKWQHEFQPSKTSPDTFEVGTNQFVTVPMMHQKAQFKHTLISEPLVELLELPYAGQDLSMVILLPWRSRDRDDREPGLELPELERQLTAANLQAWLGELDRKGFHETNVRLPRFTTTRRYDFTTQLKALGISSAFTNESDFSGIDDTRQLYLSQVFQQAFVEVNESGTEAAASTFSMVMARSMSDRFNADHPFLYLIRDNASGSILFLGRLIDPSR